MSWFAGVVAVPVLNTGWDGVCDLVRDEAGWVLERVWD